MYAPPVPNKQIRTPGKREPWISLGTCGGTRLREMKERFLSGPEDVAVSFSRLLASHWISVELHLLR